MGARPKKVEQARISGDTEKLREYGRRGGAASAKKRERIRILEERTKELRAAEEYPTDPDLESDPDYIVPDNEDPKGFIH